jgi:hypothetical protein
MFNLLKNLLLNSEVKKSNTVKKQFMEWDKAQSAVILVNNSISPELSAFIREWGKDVYIIVFHNDSTSKSTGCYLSLNKKDFNFLGLPKSQTKEKIRSRSYDILISTDFENYGPMEALSGMISAKCKLGPEKADYNRFFDICINGKREEFLRETQKYLKMIRTN